MSLGVIFSVLFAFPLFVRDELRQEVTDVSQKFKSVLLRSGLTLGIHTWLSHRFWCSGHLVDVFNEFFQ